jgi:hypothetical protein
LIKHELRLTVLKNCSLKNAGTFPVFDYCKKYALTEKSGHKSAAKLFQA